VKLKLYRQSGAPVALESRAAFEAEWKVLYDKAEAKVETLFAKTTGKLTKVPKMIMMQRMLRFVERQLVKKHNVEVLVDVPQTEADWEALIKAYEDTPVMIARTQDGTGVVAVLMDTLQG
jgi:hypothetical protein